MVWLPDGGKISKISLFVLAQLTNVTDAQTDRRTPGDGIYRDYAYASRGKNSQNSTKNDHWCTSRHMSTNMPIDALCVLCVQNARSICDSLVFVKPRLALAVRRRRQLYVYVGFFGRKIPRSNSEVT